MEQKLLFNNQTQVASIDKRSIREPYGRLDKAPEIYESLKRYCRLEPGQIWEDPVRGHRVGLLDATNQEHLEKIAKNIPVSIIVNDPPYNISVGNTTTEALSRLPVSDYLSFSKYWMANCLNIANIDCHLYIWMGADIKDNFQPLPDFMIMMRDFKDVKPRNFITLRNQRGYGTQHNWMWVRQELLHYVRGKPTFNVVYTEIPKILRGYYKSVNGNRTENLQRSKSKNIRPGNVWVDVQQVFYRLEENVPGCYAQKPLKAIERIVATSSTEGQGVLDCFSHSGTTLLAAERLGRIGVTFDIDPVFVELTIRRLENYRTTGRLGWQCENPFPEIGE